MAIEGFLIAAKHFIIVLPERAGNGAKMPVWPANAENIVKAAAILRAGGLVAFPTETVYGLGANALDAAAVAKIFAAKGRPATNPVIVHVSDEAQARSLTLEWPESAAKIVAAFWPGPLTLVLRKRPEVPDIVTSNGPTVAIRCPDHVVAQALLTASQCPLAAPSANRSTELSPTRAEHVVKIFGESVPVLDGGPCLVGIESTVVDVTTSPVRILRPGSVTLEMIRRIVPAENAADSGPITRSPGTSEKHYSPKANIVFLPDHWLMKNEIAQALYNQSAAFLLLGSQPDEWNCFYLPNDPNRYANGLYWKLHVIDDAKISPLYVELPPDSDEWRAVRDRLIKASGGRLPFDSSFAEETGGLRPPRTNSEFERGMQALSAGDAHEAIEVFTRIINASPRDAAAFQHRAQSHLLLHSRPKAIADYDAAIRIDPNNIDYRIERANELFKQRQYDRAIEDCNIIIGINHARTDVYGLRGRCYDALGDSAAALKDFERAGPAFAPRLEKLRRELSESRDDEAV